MLSAMPALLSTILTRWRKTPHQTQRLQPIVVQHEIDHINGIMFYDRINEKDPFEVKDGLLILE